MKSSLETAVNNLSYEQIAEMIAIQSNWTKGKLQQVTKVLTKTQSLLVKQVLYGSVVSEEELTEKVGLKSAEELDTVLAGLKVALAKANIRVQELFSVERELRGNRFHRGFSVTCDFHEACTLFEMFGLDNWRKGKVSA